MTKPPVKDIVTVADLSPDKFNANRGSERGLGMLEHSLRRYGAGRSVLVDRQGRIVAGNKTVERAIELGLPIEVVRTRGDKLVVVQREDLDLEDTENSAARELAVADNRTSEVSLDWDGEMLKALQAKETDLSAFFLDDELAEIIGAGAEVHAGLTDPDNVPEERPTDIKGGDLFELGDHRLLCGDSLQVEQVEKLMAGERAGLINTDPPYGIGYENDKRPNPGVAKPRVAKPRVANDRMDGEQLQAFLTSAFLAAKAIAVSEKAAWYIWFGNMPENTKFAAAAAAAKIVLHRNIIWVKPVLLLGRGQYHWKHETCFMGWVDGGRPPDYGRGAGERDQTTVWEVDSVTQAERKDFNQSTPKPVGLFTVPIVKHLRIGEIAYEPFTGTGPQFIAAQQLNRRCFGLDIEPSCCQVTIDRWEAFTGQKAKKIGEVSQR